MNDSMIVNGESKSTPTATASVTGITADAASAGEKTTGGSAADLKPSAQSAKKNTGKGRKSDPLPVSDLLNILQGVLRDLQEAGLPVSATQLPVSEGRPARVAVLMDNVIFDTGKFILAPNILAPQGVKGDPDGRASAAIVDGQHV